MRGAPGERRGDGGETRGGVAREPPARIEQPRHAAARQVREGHSAARLLEQPLEVGGDALAREGGIRRQTQRQGLAACRPGVGLQLEPRRVARRAEEPRRILDERQRVEDAKAPTLEIDRKSTRLNSSHSQISYAVFCLKKNKEPLD